MSGRGVDAPAACACSGAEGNSFALPHTAGEHKCPETGNVFISPSSRRGGRKCVHTRGLRTSCEPHWWPLCCWLGGFGYVSLFSQGCVLPVWSGGESVKDEPVQIIVKILHKLLGCVLFGANSTGVKFALDGAEEPFYSGVVAAVAEPG